MSDINIPKRFEKVTLEGYETVTDSQREAKKVVGAYIAHLDENLINGQGLTFWGPVGTGKTHLACVVLHAAIENKASAYFTTEDGLFDQFKRDWGAPDQEMRFLEKLQRVRFLVIDDMGIRRPSDYVSDRYEAIINARHASILPTIITANRTPAEIEAVYERQMSRLAGNISVNIVGPDKRKEIKDARN